MKIANCQLPISFRRRPGSPDRARSASLLHVLVQFSIGNRQSAIGNFIVLHPSPWDLVRRWLRWWLGSPSLWFWFGGHFRTRTPKVIIPASELIRDIAHSRCETVGADFGRHHGFTVRLVGILPHVISHRCADLRVDWLIHLT